MSEGVTSCKGFGAKLFLQEIFFCALCAFLWHNPFFPVFEDFFLPDRNSAFEFFDGPLAGLKSGLAVWGAGGNHDAGLADFKSSGTMNDPEVSDVEAPVRFGPRTLHLC